MLSSDCSHYVMPDAEASPGRSSISVSHTLKMVEAFEEIFTSKKIDGVIFTQVQTSVVSGFHASTPADGHGGAPVRQASAKVS